LSRVTVAKTFKQYIGGAFVRSESGRSLQTHGHNYCQGSRKDVRDAVLSARTAQSAWANRTAYNRGQILYRMAEMFEARSEEISAMASLESNGSDRTNEIQATIDRLVYYAGWADKFTAVAGSVNPIADRYFGFTFPEPMGVIGIAADDNALIGWMSVVAPVIAAGNSTVILAPDRFPLTACTVAEILATSDLPGGVVNLLTGHQAELLPNLAKHRDVNALDYRGGDEAVARTLKADGADNLKRIRTSHARDFNSWLAADAQGLSFIEAFVEMKSVWHPIGI